ncbi:MAG: M12 family metallo-peptidase [Phycisphaerales bacterium]
MSRLSAIAATAVLAVGVGLAGPAAAQTSSRSDGLKHAERYAVIDVAPLANVTAGETARVILPMPAGPLELDLKQYSIRAPDFQVLVQDDSGIRAVPAPPVRTVRGQIAGIDDSRVVGSVMNGQFIGKIQGGPDEAWISVNPLAEFEPGADPRKHVVVVASEMGDAGYRCGVDDAFLIAQGIDPIDLNALPAEPIEGGFKVTGPVGSPSAKRAGHDHDHDHSIDALAGGDFELQPEGAINDRTDVLIDADVQFFNLNGGSVPNTIGDIENVMAGVDDVYQRDLDIAWEITGVLVRTSTAANPYTTSNAEALLCEFVSEWNGGAVGTIRRDVAHLFTGRPLIGTTIGIAFNSVICNAVSASGCGGPQNVAYGLVESRFSTLFDARVSLSAHELGHNYNAGHCAGGTCHIMCAELNGCGGTIGADLVFGPTATNEIVSFRNGLNCLDPQTPAINPPLVESWGSSTIDTNRWNWFNNDLSVTSSGPTPPNGVFSLELRSFGSVLLRDGDIRSTEVLLGGQSGMFFQAVVARTGTSAGDALVVEYRDPSDNWRELVTSVSDGNDTEFTPLIVSLPAFAYHNKFRLRMRIDADGFSPRFYVDEIRVGELEVDPPCQGDIDGDDIVAFSDLLSVLSAFGDCPPGECAADLDEDGVVGFSDVLAVLSAWGPCE